MQLNCFHCYFLDQKQIKTFQPIFVLENKIAVDKSQS